MPLFDTHFHLRPEDDLDGICRRAAAADVGWMLVAGAEVGQMGPLLGRLAGRAGIYAAAGVHPHSAAKFDGDLAPYRAWAASDQVRAIGEIGLDYFYDFSEPQTQLPVFRQFLQLARQLHKPAVVHCRDAYDDCYRCLQEELAGEVGFVVHCFTGTPAWAERFLALGGHLSFTGILTFKKSVEVRDALRVVPLDRLMFETDSPYLAPVPHRGKTNEPAFVGHVVARAAAEFNLTPAELAAISTRNALAFFGLPSGAPTLTASP